MVSTFHYLKGAFMFNLKLDDPGLLKKIVAVLGDFITEASFTIDKQGMKLIAMDPANICMVNLLILPSAFAEYEVESKDEITMNLNYLQQAISRAKSGETVQLTLSENRLLLSITGKSVKKYYIPLLEKEDKEKRVPELEFNIKLDMNANELKDYVDDVSIVGDAMTIDSTAEKVMISAGETGSRVKIDLAKDSEAIIKLGVKEPARAIYSIDYMKKLAKSATIADTVSLQYSTDYPVQLEFKSLNKLKLQFILAPRIENR